METTGYSSCIWCVGGRVRGKLGLVSATVATNAENAELELIAATTEETEEAWYVCISELNFVHFFSS